MYKVIIIYEGFRSEDDELFETYEEAEDYALDCCSCASLGAETLHMSNPGDYPDEEADIDYEIIEV